jgi:hypothetical protein
VPSSAASVVACLKYKCAWWFPGEPDAAVHLDGVRRDPGECGRACRLRDTRCQRRVIRTVRQRPYRVIRGRTGMLELDEQVGQPVLDRLGSCVAPTASPRVWPTTCTPPGRDHPQPPHWAGYNANLLIDQVSFTAHALRTNPREPLQ